MVFLTPSHTTSLPSLVLYHSHHVLSPSFPLYFSISLPLQYSSPFPTSPYINILNSSTRLFNVHHTYRYPHPIKPSIHTAPSNTSTFNTSRPSVFLLPLLATTFFLHPTVQQHQHTPYCISNATRSSFPSNPTPLYTVWSFVRY